MIKRLQTLLEQQPNVELAFLYGSHAVQKATAESDLDIAIAATEALTLEERLALAEALSIEFQCEVDIVDLGSAHGALLQEILTRGICVVKRNLPLYEKLIKRMLMEKEDDSRIAARATKERIQKWQRQTKP
jgi:predicted nucleotidyltransferase